MKERVYLRTFSVAPIHTDDDLDSYQRIPELVASLKNEVIYAPGGGILVTGYRGVGKTSFVNKVLFDAKKDLNARNYELIEVRLNLARGYSTDKLLRRLIRELYFAINQHGIYEDLPDDLRRKLEIAFLRTSQQIKTALSHGLRDIITRNESESETHSRGYALSPSVGIDKISASLASLSRQDSRSKSSSKTTTEEMSQERGIELEFLEYDDEIAENDLSELINLLTHSSTTTKKEDWEPGFDGKLKAPQWLWKRLPNKVWGRAINRYIEVPRAPLLKGQEQKRIKLIFVLDEIDKMSVDQAEEIFRSLKNLFLKGNVTFILLTGIEFYFDRLWKLVSEDDILYTLFTRFVHIPLFSEQELDVLVYPDVKDNVPEWFTDLLMHLKYRAKGTPREFYRELFRRVEWDKGRPNIEWTDTNETDKRIVYFSKTLLPHVYEQLKAVKAKQLDQGIYDFIYRNMFNWLEWMTFWGTFSKSTLLRPVTEDENPAETNHKKPNRPTSKLLTNRHVLAALDDLIRALVANQLIEQTGTLNNEPVYEFVGQLKEYQAEIDSSVAFGLQNEEAERKKQINQIIQSVTNSINEENFGEAQRVLQEAIAVLPTTEELTKAQQELGERLKLRELETLGDKQYQDGNFESATRTFEEIKQRSGNNLAIIREKHLLSLLQWALQSLDHVNETGNYDEVMDLFMRARHESQEEYTPQIVELRQSILEKTDTLMRQINLYRNIVKSLDENNLESAKSSFELLRQIEPESTRVNKLLEQIQYLEKTYDRLNEIRDLVVSGQFELARKNIRDLLLTSDQRLREEVQQLADRIERVHNLALRVEQDLEFGDPMIAQKRLEELNQVFPLSSDSPLAKKVTEKVEHEYRIQKLQRDIDETIFQDNLTAWDYFDELEPLLASDSRSKKIYRDLEMATLGKAKEVTNDIFRTITPGETVFTNYELEAHDPELAVATVSRILAPLLKRDPDHVEANSILRILKERLGG